MEKVHLGIHWPNRKSMKIKVMAGHTHTNIHRGSVNKTNTNHTVLADAQVNASRIDLSVR